MIARAVILVILVIALLGGAGLYYLQVYAYYDEVPAEEIGDIELVLRDTGMAVPIAVDNLRAIDSTSSPVRFRACFDTPLALGDLVARHETHPNAVPLNAPGWFGCFDAAAIGTALESGVAVAFMGTENITYGIDRVVAIMPDGRGYAWHQINRCGSVVFDGQPVPDDCPPAPES